MSFLSARQILNWDCIRLMPGPVQRDEWCTLTGPDPRPGKPTWRITKISGKCPIHGQQEAAS